MNVSNDLMDESSRLKQFAWDEWDNQFIVVIFRPGKSGLDRYVVKRYLEQVFSQSDRWKQLSTHFSTIPPYIRAYSLTSHELELMRKILDCHLGNKYQIRLTQTYDQLIEYEQFLDLISQADQLHKHNSNPYRNFHSINQQKSLTIPTVYSTYTLPSVPQSLDIIQSNHHHHPSSIESDGWIQINNVYLPFLTKNQQRLVPYQVLVSCKILDPNELRSVVRRATSPDVSHLNKLIHDSKVENQRIPENTFLINLHHVLIGTKNLIYAKFLPKTNPTSKINHQYKNVLELNGGMFELTRNLIPYVCSNNQTYVPFNDIFNLYPKFEQELKNCTRVPRTDELDYLQLIRMYYKRKEYDDNSVLLININELNQREILLTKMMNLNEFHSKEKMKFEQQILLLKNSINSNKRKHPESNENQQIQQKVKSSTSATNQWRFNSIIARRIPQNNWLQANGGHRGRPRLH